jgi:hypothetical protein
MQLEDGRRPTNTLAIASLVGGISSWAGFLCLGAVVGIVCGHLARSQIRRTDEEGDGLALAGLILGYLHLAVTFVVGVIWLLFFGGMVAIGLASGAAHH